MQPTDAESLDRKGLALFSSHSFLEAAACFRQAIVSNPGLASYHEHLGTVLLVMGKPDEAERCFQKALTLDAGSFESLLHMACLMQARNLRAAAEPYFKKAIKANPASYVARFRWSLALMQFGDPVSAERELLGAIEVDPNAPEARELLGSLLAQKGDMDSAVVAFEKSIALNPTVSASAFHGLVTSKRITAADRELVEKMRSVLSDGRPLQGSLAVMHVALGKALDDLGEYEACMEQFGSARRIAALERHAKPFDRRAAALTVDNYKKFFPAEAFSRAGHGVDTDLPVFIVGMPRSGSTLLEQILSCHRDIGAAGEIDAWRRSPIATDPRRVFRSEVARDQAVQYRRLLRSIAPTKRRIIDKTLPNYTMMGPLHLMFPQARFIHCRRHPVDTCLSISMNTLLLPTPPDYIYDLADMVVAYKSYLQLMEHWRSVLPASCLMEVDYEELVVNREPVARRLVEFCGLQWDDACLHHENNAREVLTPSKWQVRQPLYSSSVERWQRYEPWLGPLRELLP